jgi:hypothetical protein
VTQHLTPVTNWERSYECNFASGSRNLPDRIWRLHVWREYAFASDSWTLVALWDLAALPRPKFTVRGIQWEISCR